MHEFILNSADLVPEKFNSCSNDVQQFFRSSNQIKKNTANPMVLASEYWGKYLIESACRICLIGTQIITSMLPAAIKIHQWIKRGHYQSG